MGCFLATRELLQIGCGCMCGLGVWFFCVSCTGASGRVDIERWWVIGGMCLCLSTNVGHR